MAMPAGTIKRIPHPFSPLCLLGLLAANMLLFMGRKHEALRSDAILDVAPTFYSHVSNFSLSLMLYAGIGFFWLMMGVTRRHVLALGFVIAACNLAYEFFVPILNTPDPVDAWYGLAGTAAGAAFLLLCDRFGFLPRAD